MKRYFKENALTLPGGFSPEKLNQALSNRIEEAKRTVNDLFNHQRELTTKRDQRSEFARFIDDANENSASTHHNGHHIARVIFIFGKLLEVVPEYQLLNTILIDSSEFTIRYHDWDQQHRIQQNLISKSRLSPKQGHALAGTIEMMALYREYAEAYQRGENKRGKQTELNIDKAKKICFIAGIWNARHDEPEKYAKLFLDTKKAYTLGDQGEKIPLPVNKEFIKAFKENEYDPYSLSSHQYVALLKHEKQSFIEEEKTKYGLHPFVEERYERELAELAHDTTPLEDYLQVELRNRDLLNFVAEAFIRADLADMKFPPLARVSRSILTMGSGRPIYPKGVKKDKLLDAILNLPGNDSPDDDCYSDVRRLAFECRPKKGKSLFPNSRFDQNSIVQQMDQETDFLGAIAQKVSLSEVIKGGVCLISAFDISYKQRIKMFTKEVGRKYGINFDSLIESTPAETVSEYAYRMSILFGRNSRRCVDSWNGPYQQSLMNILAERDQLITVLASKPNANEYDIDDRQQFIEAMDEIILQLGGKMGLDKEQITWYEKQVALGEVPISDVTAQFFKASYDSYLPLGNPKGYE